MFPKNIKKESGYTIIEMMIAISVFLVVVTMGMGALLNANLLHQKTQDMRSILDSLNFTMDDMSRNLRTGYNYHCIDGTLNGSEGGSSAYSCPGGGGGISFTASDGSRWEYYMAFNPSINDSKALSIFRLGGGEINPVQLTSNEVAIDSMSLFSVIGAEPPPNTQQPFVTIKLVGSILYKGASTPFSIQTSVSQRQIDIGT